MQTQLSELPVMTLENADQSKLTAITQVLFEAASQQQAAETAAETAATPQLRVVSSKAVMHAAPIAALVAKHWLR